LLESSGLFGQQQVGFAYNQRATSRLTQSRAGGVGWYAGATGSTHGFVASSVVPILVAVWLFGSVLV